MREYKEGCRWAAWRWSSGPFITRLHLLKTPFGSVYVHWLQPDPVHWLHDHPVTFLSIILRGWYIDLHSVVTPMLGTESYAYTLHRRFNYIRASYRHRITTVAPGTMTLCFAGPVRRKWGYHTPAGWVYYKDYKNAP